MKHADIMAYLKARTIEEGCCLLWTMAVNDSGQPVATIAGKAAVSVRRWAWQKWHGKEAGSLRIVAGCNNLRCVHPECAQAMTPSDVNRWIAQRGGMSTPAVRLSRTRNGRKLSPLTIEDVRAMRARHAAGETAQAISEGYPVSVETVSKICRGERWIDHAANPFAQLARAVA